MDYTARFLEAQQQVGVRVPVLPLLEPPGPRPALTRIVFTRDSIEWGHAATVGDLLSSGARRLPLARRVHRPARAGQLPGRAGRPRPSTTSTACPTWRRAWTASRWIPRSSPSASSTGSRSSAGPGCSGSTSSPGGTTGSRRGRASRSRGATGTSRATKASLERRFANGIGFALAGDYLNSPTASGTSSSYSNTQFLLQGNYVPTPTLGLAVSARPLGRRTGGRSSSTIRCRTTPSASGSTRRGPTPSSALSWRAKRGGLGPRVDLLYGRTGWDGAGIEQQVNQVGGALAYRTPDASRVGASGVPSHPMDRARRPGDRGLESGARGGGQRGGGAPAALRRAQLRLRGARRRPPAGARARPHRARRDSAKLVAAPAIPADTAQEISDYEAAIGWERERLGLRLAFSRTAPFSPFGYAEFPRIASIGAAPEIDWLTASARLAPLRWLTLEGWYSDPRDVIPGRHSADPLDDGGHAPLQVPAPVPQRHLRPQASVRAWNHGARA